MESWLSATNLSALAEVMFVNVVLSGDNAVVVGMAAAGLEPRLRNRAIAAGIVGATVLRIVFSLIASQMLTVVGLTFVGGALLAWVSWKMWVELREARIEGDAEDPGGRVVEFPQKTFAAAMWQILVADVSMSLDNVLAVVGIARTNLMMLAIGLVMSILLMGVASSLIAGLLARYRWISYVGLALIVFVAASMLWDGSREIARHAGWLAVR
ncbi:MAG TPA: TerC family protein [Candidatus Sulfotelmatobacter sp.]|nr:TerC family protein [Candidatus Sulfotelmatobacter sp.]